MDSQGMTKKIVRSIESYFLQETSLYWCSVEMQGKLILKANRMQERTLCLVLYSQALLESLQAVYTMA